MHWLRAIAVLSFEYITCRVAEEVRCRNQAFSHEFSVSEIILLLLINCCLHFLPSVCFFFFNSDMFACYLCWASVFDQGLIKLCVPDVEIRL